MEVDDELPEEAKSQISGINSQEVSRTETPIEEIETPETPKRILNVVGSPVTISSETKSNPETIQSTAPDSVHSMEHSTNDKGISDRKISMLDLIVTRKKYFIWVDGKE